jgi:hypothetical protein
MATGLHGQMLFVSTALDLVIAHYGSHVQSPTTPAPPFMTTFFRIGTYLRTA